MKLVFKKNSGVDSTTTTVISGGCASIYYDGDSLERMNAHNICDTTDGVYVCNCAYNGKLLSGPCDQNNLDTSCGGQLPFYYTNNNDSIINPCRFPSKDIFTPEGVQRPDSAIVNTSTSGVKGTEYMQGVNRLSSDLRNEGALS